MPEDETPPAAVRRALTDINRAVEVAAAAVGAESDSLVAFRLATDLTETLRGRSHDTAELRILAATQMYDAKHMSLSDLAEQIGVSKARAAQLIRSGRSKLSAGVDELLEAEPSNKPEPGPVVATIVTSHLGVLVGKRNDGKPPWTFIAGEIEPGESPADAAIREVKEETGLRIHAGGLIGRRVHPKTGRTMVYMAAQPTHGTDVFVGDKDELAEVRWVSLGQADELMSGMIYEPVRKHLRQTLGND